MSDEPPVLVTGAGGCIGSWILRQLVAESVPVVALDLRPDDRRLSLLLDDEGRARVTWVSADITDRAMLQKLFQEHEFASVIHLAALQAPFCRADPPLGAAVNVLGTVNLMEAITTTGDGAAPFVYASSVAAANRVGGSHPETIYGVYKRANEGAADVYLREGGLSSIGLRPHTVYGPGRDQGFTSAPTVAMLAAAAGRPYEVPFTGRLTMQYAADVAAAFVAASRLEDYSGAEVFDLPGETVAIEEVLEAIDAASPGAAITAIGPPLPFPAEVAPRADAPFGSALTSTPLSGGVGDTIARFSDLLERGLIEFPV